MTNLTLFAIASSEGAMSEQLWLSIDIRRDVTHFSELASVVEGLQSIDALLRTDLGSEKPLALNRDLLQARAQLRRFTVRSDPVADVVANYPWVSILALVVVAVRDYEKFKSSATVLKADASAFIDGIANLAADQKLKIAAGTQLLIEHLVELSDDTLSTLIARLDRARKSICGANGEQPQVTFTGKDG